MVARLGNISALKDFLSFLATVSGDISHITAPPFILAPQSLTQFPSYWAERPLLFTAVAHETDPARRMLSVLKFYLASLQRQYYVGRTVKEGLKKPLNPYLGELFFAEFSDQDISDEKASCSKVRVIAEQVSHHPPTTACFLSADDHGVRAEAYSTQVTTFAGTSVVIRQSGHAVLTVDKYDETYLLPLPDVTARSIISGVPWPELNGSYKILSSSGYTADMRFVAKGFGEVTGMVSRPRSTEATKREMQRPPSSHSLAAGVPNSPSSIPRVKQSRLSTSPTPKTHPHQWSSSPSANSIRGNHSGHGPRRSKPSANPTTVTWSGTNPRWRMPSGRCARRNEPKAGRGRRCFSQKWTTPRMTRSTSWRLSWTSSIPPRPVVYGVPTAAGGSHRTRNRGGRRAVVLTGRTRRLAEV